MQATATTETIETGALKAKQNTLLSPRFYTTDSRLWIALTYPCCARSGTPCSPSMRAITTTDHFQRTPEFAREVAEQFSGVSPELREEFLDSDQFVDLGVFGGI